MTAATEGAAPDAPKNDVEGAAEAAVPAVTTYLTQEAPAGPTGEDDGGGSEDDPADEPPPWVVLGFTVLSGLGSERARRDRYLVPTQTWADESGGKGQGLFTFAPLSMTVEKWAAFSREWSDALARSPAVPIFKWDGAHKLGREKLLSLVRVINASGLRYLPIVVDAEGFEKTIAPAVSKPAKWKRPWPFDHVKFWSYLAAMVGIAHDLKYGIGQKEPFEMIFDEECIFEPRVRLWYPLLRATVSQMRRDLAPILPAELQFRKDTQFMPLQASDLFAGLLRERYTAGDPHGLQWIADEIEVVCPGQQVVNRATMQQQAALMGPNARAELMELALKVYG